MTTEKPSFSLPSKAALQRTSFTVPQRIINTYVKMIPLEERRDPANPYTSCIWQVCPQLIKSALKVRPDLKNIIAHYNKHRKGINLKRWHGYLAYILVDALNLFDPSEKNPDESIPRCVPPAVRKWLYTNQLQSRENLSKSKEENPTAEIPLAMTYHQNTVYCCWTALTVDVDEFVGGSWGNDKSEVDEIYCPFKGYVAVGVSAPNQYKLKTSFNDANNINREKNILCQKFYEVYNWELEKAHVQEAWYLMHFEGWTYAQLSAHFGYSARSTFCMKFSRLYKIVEKWLETPIEGSEVEDKEEIHLTQSDKLKELYSAFFKRIDWVKRGNRTEKQVFICFHFLGWGLETIKEEFLLSDEAVRYILGSKWGEATMRRYLRDGLLDSLPCKILSYDEGLTLQEKFPNTPKMQREQLRLKQAVDEVILANNYLSNRKIT